jgi:nucleoside triphosphate diphosphatase
MSHKTASESANPLQKIEASQGIDKLLTVMQALRDPETGCTWDIQQSYQSILPYTIEEVYEVAEAIETKDFESLIDELGDLLFQIVFYAQIGKEEGRFDFYQVVEVVCDKLIRRHPHVFAKTQSLTEEQLNDAWEQQKQLEREQKASAGSTPTSPSSFIKASVLDDIPKALPELKRAHKIQKRASKTGFDWEHVEQVWHKVEEESLEVKEAAASGNKEHLEEELGDLLFAVVNLTRHYKVDAEMALRKANQKFDKRFRFVESETIKPLSDSSLAEMEALWLQAKKQ